MSEEESQQCGCVIEGDILEEIVSHVPLVDLVSANNVSSSWRSAISASLLRRNTPKPWLILHSQSTRSPSAVTTFAYDPRSHHWLHFNFQHDSHHHYFSPLRASHSSLLYMLSPSKFAFSLDPLHLHWHQAHPPIAWHPDPAVAAVGNHIILAASTASTGIPDHDPTPPLQIYDTATRTWEWCNSMPTELMDSAASTWLSVATDENQNRIYVSVKSSGVTYWFDPRGKRWCGPYNVRGEVGGVFYSAIEFGGNGMVAVGLTGEAEDVRSVVVWEVEGGKCKWEMPYELMERLKGESGYMPSISLNVMEDLIFVHNPLEPRAIITCELKPNRPCRWGCLTATFLDDSCRFRNLVFSCSSVTLARLDHAFKLGIHRSMANVVFFFYFILKNDQFSTYFSK